MNRTILYSIALFSLILLSCKKDEAPPLIYENLNLEFKAKYSFGVGSYWVYENNFGDLDSIVVNQVLSDYTNVTPTENKQSELLTIEYQNITQGEAFNHFLYNDQMKYNGGGKYGELGQPIYIYNKPINYGFNGVTITDKMDSILILGETYYDIEKTTISEAEQYSHVFDYDRDIYFSPNIGIVKFVIHATAGTITWNLKNYVVQ